MARRLALAVVLDAALLPVAGAGGAYEAVIRGIVPNGPGYFFWNVGDWWLDG